MQNLFHLHFQKTTGLSAKNSPRLTMKKKTSGKPGGVTTVPPGLNKTRTQEIQRFPKKGAAVLPIVKGGKTPPIAWGYKAASKDKAGVGDQFREKPSLQRDKVPVLPDNGAQKSNAPDKHIAAKTLISVGFKVVPLTMGERGVAGSGKKPLTAHGVKDATNDIATFKRLIPAAVDCNIGVATGSASGVIVIDVDPRNDGLREFKGLIKRYGLLPPTLTCETGGGGRHYYFRAPDGGMTKKLLAPGVDLLAEGCYAVAPPSLHSSGKRYQWLQDRGPGSQSIASLPDAWLQFIKASNQAPDKPVARDGEAIPEGSRNTVLASVAGHLRRAGLSETEMLAALRGVNAARCDPPLDDEEVAQIARNVAQYPEGPSRATKDKKSRKLCWTRSLPAVNGSATNPMAISGLGLRPIGP
jgi:hypothetical protein